jgi:hypothetical protein
MKKLMLATLALAAAFTLTADNYTPSSIPSGLTEPDVTPGEINYQGLLRNPKDGNLYKDGIYTLECRIYTDESTGTPLWGASYSAYVKDGYFNLMLGSADGATLSGCTYGPTSLWKALWYTTGRRDLYLGVTPRQGADGSALVSPQEIKPRQKLLTAPFAFRAQKAQYADAAPGNFNVGGNLEVAGNVTVTSGKKLTLKNISASDSDIKIGTSKTSPATTTLQGRTVTIESGSALNVNSHGSATVTIDSGKTLNVTGGNILTSNNTVTLDGSNRIEVRSPTIHGTGKLKWNTMNYPSGSLGTSFTPVIFQETELILKNGNVGVTMDLESAIPTIGQNVQYYNWGIVGYTMEGTIPQVITMQAFKNLSGKWRLSVRVKEAVNRDFTITVNVIGVLNQLSGEDFR